MKKTEAYSPGEDLKSAAAQAVAEREAAEAKYTKLTDRRAQTAADLASAKTEVRARAAARAAGDDVSKTGEALRAATLHAADLEATLRAFDEELIPEAHRLLEAATEREGTVLRLVQREAAEAESTTAAKNLVRRYTAVLAELDDIRQEIARATQAVDAYNLSRPPGEPPLTGPEMAIRDQPAKPMEVLSEEIVHQWIYPATGHRLPEQTAASVRDRGNGRGELPAEVFGSMSVSGPTEVVRRRFRKLRYRPAQLYRAGPRLADIQLPPLKLPTHDVEQTDFLPEEIA